MPRLINGRPESYWNHIYVCKPCGVTCNSMYSLISHCNGKSHLKVFGRKGFAGLSPNQGGTKPNVSQECQLQCGGTYNPNSGFKRGGKELINGHPSSYWEHIFICACCDVSCGSEHSFIAHCKGKKHTKKFGRQGFAGLKMNDGGIIPNLTERVKRECGGDYATLLTLATSADRPNGANPRKLILEQVNHLSLKFYKDVLENNAPKRGECENRQTFAQELKLWLQREEKTYGEKYLGVPKNCSAVLFSLKKQKILRVAKSMGDSSIIAFVKCSNGKPKSAKEIVQDTVRRVLDGREEQSQNRGGFKVGEITIGGDESVLPPGVPVSQNVLCETFFVNSPFSLTVKEVNSRKSGMKINLVSNPRANNYTVSLSFTPKSIGITRTTLSFEFNKKTAITRFITFRCGKIEDEEILKPSAPFKRNKRMTVTASGIRFDNAIDDGPPKTGMKRFPITLKKYEVPSNWRDSLATNSAEDEFNELMGGTEKDSGKELNPKNYKDVFQKLLWTEEVQMESDIRLYDIESTTIQRIAFTKYRLNVPGLAEARPSVLKGDKITIALRALKGQTQAYRGHVERTELEDAIISLPRQFENHFIDGCKVSVRFHFKRLPLQTSHQAISDFSLVSKELTLFPSKLAGRRILQEPQYAQQITQFTNRNLNSEQRDAVSGAVQNVCRPSPYLIYGPPGTGKSVTIVECILQTLKHKAGPILVCAPSNSAVDLIVERLVEHVDNLTLLRIMAYSRDKKAVSKSVLPYARYDPTEDAFVLPSLEEMKRHRIIAVTLATCGKLPNLGLASHFSHILMDESGHAIEPEAVAAFSTVAVPDASIVLAGDPKQMGPIIRSDLAKANGLDISLLERLSLLSAYERGDGALPNYDKRILTKLVRNYRSHPEILKLPNEFFYDNDLKADAEIFRSHALVKWEHLPKEGFPCIFHGVQGVDDREGNSPSWFNASEASVVKEYVNKLMNETKKNRCTAEDIGIVTPYAKQAQKIRLLLAKSGDQYKGIKVGSIDEFQGQERRVIIISTVRSSVEYIGFDEKYNLGFVSNPKRFNVAITRAQALVIVVGNPKVLRTDKHWKGFLDHCVSNGGYVGVELGEEELDKEVDSLSRDLGSLIINAEEEEARNNDQGDDDFVMIQNNNVVEGGSWRTEE